MTTSKSSSTNLTQDGQISTDLLTLGKLLAEELGESDTLGRWIAHHIADLIGRAEAAPADSAAKDAVSSEILRLWSHRAVISGERRPLESFDPVLRGLARLDPEMAPWLRGLQSWNRDGGRVQELVDQAVQLNQLTARVSKQLFQHAASLAAEDEKRWLQTASLESDDPLALIFDSFDLDIQGNEVSDGIEPPDDARPEQSVEELAALAIEALSKAIPSYRPSRSRRRVAADSAGTVADD